MVTLADRSISEKGAQIAKERGGTYRMPREGEHLSGRYRGAAEFVSGNYALIKRHAREFALAP